MINSKIKMLIFPFALIRLRMKLRRTCSQHAVSAEVLTKAGSKGRAIYASIHPSLCELWRTRRARVRRSLGEVGSARTARGAISGFSLLETIIALMIITAMAVPLVMMQATSLRRVTQDARQMDRMFAMRSLLYEAIRATPEGSTSYEMSKTIPPNTQLKYQLMPPPANSALTAFKGMHVQRVTATWYEQGKKKEDALVTAIYIEPKPTNETPK